MFSPTDYLESNALLAVSEDFRDEAIEILEQMTLPELRCLRSTASSLMDLCADVIHTKLESGEAKE